MAEFLQALERLSPGLLYALIAGFAAVENFFPPVPADTVIALGALLAGRGKLDAWTVFGVGWAANVGGAALLYGLARRYGRPLFAGRFGRRLLPQSVLERLALEYHRHGTYGIFLSRLLPVWRAVVTPFAGIAGLSAPKALLPVALASALWYGAVTALVVRLTPSLEAMLVYLGRVNGVLAAVALAAAIVVAFLVWRRLKSGRKGSVS